MDAPLVKIETINAEKAEILWHSLTNNLPEYFGIPEANKQYAQGIRECQNLAAKVGNINVGLLSLNFPYINNSNIYWMAVLPEYHGKGIGKKLVEAACKLARNNHATTLSVETLAPSEADENYLKTYHFYNKLGFEPLINIKPEGYIWHMVYMVKNLDNPLDELLYLERDARTFGFDWPNETMIIDAAIDECNEIKEVLQNNEARERIQEEIGDLLHSAISLCEFAGFNVEETLANVNVKFAARLEKVKTLTHELGLPNLQGKSFEFMLDLWRKAKITTT